MPSRRRLTVFWMTCTLCVAVSVAYVSIRARHVASDDGALNTPLQVQKMTGSTGTAMDKRAKREPSESLRVLPGKPFVIFRSTVFGADYGQLAAVPVDDLSRVRAPLGLSCERAYYAGGYGVCLSAQRGMVTAYHAYIFDSAIQPIHKLPLLGIPSRTRISPDGRYAAITVFVSGHSYAPGTFSTRVEIFRTADGGRVIELEQLSVERDGQPFREVDFNFWGVTFASDNRFYATLGTGGKNYLLEGDLASRHARVIQAGIECPSLSPDGRRIAFKRVVNSGWHIHVLDLRSGAVTPLAEVRNIDDQVEWLDDNRILYAFENDIWVTPADGAGAPAVFLPNAFSPAVVR